MWYSVPKEKTPDGHRFPPAAYHSQWAELWRLLFWNGLYALHNSSVSISLQIHVYAFEINSWWSCKVVNMIKILSIQNNSALCDEMGSTYNSLFLHTVLRWLSREKVLTRLIELRSEVLLLLTDIDDEKSKFFLWWWMAVKKSVHGWHIWMFKYFKYEPARIKQTFYAGDKIFAFVGKLKYSRKIFQHWNTKSILRRQKNSVKIKWY